MNFSTLSATEKMAVFASAVVAILGLWSFSNAWGSLMLVAVLAAIGMLLVLFAPGVMPNTRLPGSKGSLMLITGGIAAVIWALTALRLSPMDLRAPRDLRRAAVPRRARRGAGHGLVRLAGVPGGGWQVPDRRPEDLTHKSADK